MLDFVKSLVAVAFILVFVAMVRGLARTAVVRRAMAAFIRAGLDGVDLSALRSLGRISILEASDVEKNVSGKPIELGFVERIGYLIIVVVTRPVAISVVTAAVAISIPISLIRITSLVVIIRIPTYVRVSPMAT